MSKKLMHIESVIEDYHHDYRLRTYESLIKDKQKQEEKRKKLIEKLRDKYDVIVVETNTTIWENNGEPRHFITYTYKCYNTGESNVK